MGIRGVLLGKSKRGVAEAAGRGRGARGVLGGRSPPLLLGKRVGPDDALSPLYSRCDSWAPCAASIPAGGQGVGALGSSPERKHLLSRPAQSSEPWCRVRGPLGVFGFSQF